MTIARASVAGARSVLDRAVWRQHAEAHVSAAGRAARTRSTGRAGRSSSATSGSCRADDARSNYRMAREALLDARADSRQTAFIPIPDGRRHGRRRGRCVRDDVEAGARDGCRRQAFDHRSRASRRRARRPHGIAVPGLAGARGANALGTCGRGADHRSASGAARDASRSRS